MAKRERFRIAFAGFEFHTIADFTDDVQCLLGDAGIVRHRGTIETVINKARRAAELEREAGSLAAYFRRFEPAPNEVDPPQTVSTSPASVALSKDLMAGVGVVPHSRDVPREFGGDGRPPLAQRGAGGWELACPFGDQRAGGHSEFHRFATVPAHRTEHARLLLRLLAAAVLPGLLHRCPQRDPGQVDPGQLAGAQACPRVV
ncbi:DNA-3-methyladenine glycosylase I [Streptomyces sp. NBC_00285]|uniref:DNA-3-methyladenine glycosylase I n=1 Tax=Streptomyces sp. NBC_00285 TaxID=2975700 RepID=UPI002E2B17AD|nr:DNA-3-methyladenine glycosylase I [Streptomyces sp. NBC_00285]